MELLFANIPLDRVTTSMTINAPASILLAMYLAVARRHGIPFDKVGGTIQNDVLKEYAARGTYIFPPKPGMRLITDVMAFCATDVPNWNTISISGYHIREAGSTALQELAFTLSNAKAYLRAAKQAGLDPDTVAPRISFFWNAHNDFFEEIAKFRAGRHLWAHITRDEFGCTDPRSHMLRFHAQTGGSTLTAQEPDNNVVRVTIQALAAVLGGVQSLHTNGMDEALGLPTADAARVALRTQQIIAYESGVVNTADPLGGSYFVEALTGDVERGACDYIAKIDALGGMVAAIERAYPQREIAEASYRYQMAVDHREKIIVGVNDFIAEEKPIDTLQIDETVAHRQGARLRKLRADRSQAEVDRRLLALRKAAEGSENLMPYLYEAVKAYATLGEVCDAMREVFGIYEEIAIT